MVRLAIDYENPSRAWWAGGGQELWDGAAEGFDGGAILLDRSVAESWLAEAAKIAGWEDGPDYAPHPVRIEDVDEDEEL